MRAAWVGTGGESQNHSPLVGECLARPGTHSMRVDKERQFQRVRGQILGLLAGLGAVPDEPVESGDCGVKSISVWSSGRSLAGHCQERRPVNLYSPCQNPKDLRVTSSVNGEAATRLGVWSGSKTFLGRLK
ncbi:hypothetical protein TNCV_1928051 [Trichonephila clavipes]|nr:hypothetical protein TNCV_1928051 [Trichonephila clavipes]